MTIRSAVDAAKGRLTTAGIPADEAALDARLLAQFVLGWDDVRFVTRANESWLSHATDLSRRYDELVSRRARREPLAYITGEREFWGLAFEVSPAVLIPRPETELIIEAVLQLVPDRTAPIALADVCTGSGCLAVALAHEYPNAAVTATDISSDALTMARRNAIRHGIAERLHLIESDLLTASAQRFDVIVCNPPYVAEADRTSLQSEVRDYEPAVALFAGDDGLDVVRRIVADVPARLMAGGLLLFEFGFGQAAAVEQLISATGGLTMVGLRQDLQDIPRVAIARHP